MSGPAFLYKHKDAWDMYNDIPKLPITHPEIKSEPPTVMAVIATKEPIDDLINYYSSWDRLKRAVAWLKRFLKVLQKKAQPSAYLTADEVTNAEQCIIKHVQTSAFSADMKRLVSGRTLSIHSPLHRLDPTLMMMVSLWWEGVSDTQVSSCPRNIHASCHTGTQYPVLSLDLFTSVAIWAENGLSVSSESLTGSLT